MKIFFYILVFVLASLPLFTLDASEIKVMYCNLENYFVEGDVGGKPKDEISRNALADIVKLISPDILLVCEMGSQNGLRDFSERLASRGCAYPFVKMVFGFDDTRRLCIFSKYVPTDFRAETGLTYSIKPKDSTAQFQDEVPVQRGFLHSVFTFENGYVLHLIGAHLKSRVFHPRYNQTDMRRYEARLLKYYVDKIRENNPKANVLVVGDMNDTFDTDPIKTLRSPEKTADKRLYDLRPLDRFGIAWTHWWSQVDAYGRIDYAFASYGLLPELSFSENSIPHVQDLWMLGSDHRPLLIKIRTEEGKELGEEKVNSVFKDAIYLPGGDK